MASSDMVELQRSCYQSDLSAAKQTLSHNASGMEEESARSRFLF
jgi:hypothetical protein